MNTARVITINSKFTKLNINDYPRIILQEAGIQWMLTYLTSLGITHIHDAGHGYQPLPVQEWIQQLILERHHLLRNTSFG